MTKKSTKTSATKSTIDPKLMATTVTIDPKTARRLLICQAADDRLDESLDDTVARVVREHFGAVWSDGNDLTV